MQGMLVNLLCISSNMGFDLIQHTFNIANYNSHIVLTAQVIMFNHLLLVSRHRLVQSRLVSPGLINAALELNAESRLEALLEKYSQAVRGCAFVTC